MASKNDQVRSASWGGAMFLSLFLLLTTLSFGQNGKLSRDIADTTSSKSIDVIVQYKVPPTDTHFNRVNGKGGKMKRDLRGAIKGAAFTVPANQLSALANDPDVTFVS